ncbi:MAG: protein kinase domain-containing protein [Thermoanaerobaculia bacterium]
MLAAQQVGRFELRDFLGRGAMGDVYLAWDPEAGREVALKLVRTQRTDPEMLQAERNGVALQEEISRLAPQVAAVYEWGEEGPFFWVAMEYVAGQDLSQILSRGPLPEDKAASIALQLCHMLEVCHNVSTEIGGRKVYGIIHGDIKPENIRLQEGERVRVLDFGIAKHLSQTRRFTVNLFGSLPYTPPERLDRGGVDRQSDLWAVGVVLYLMVAGYSPFMGEDPEEVEGKIRSGQPPLPLPEGVPADLRTIIEKSLAFRVSDRYGTAAEIQADLEAWSQGLPLPSRQPRPAVAGEDLSATRRTRQPLDDTASRLSETRRTDRPSGLDATRRTGEPVVIPPPPPMPSSASSPAAMPLPPLSAEPPPAPPPTRRLRGLRRLQPRGVGMLLLLVGSLGLASQVWVRGEASDLRHDLATETSPDVDALWDRYQKVAPFGLIPGSGLGDVRTELREALLKSADRTLDSYHGDSPTTTERGWQKAHDRLKAAVDLNYRDKPTRAKMVYARGHLDRIASQGLRAKGQRDEARQKVRDAVDEFRDAAKLAPEWPDPYLGLARVYAYEQFDLKQLEEALSELERRGYPMGRREKAMLGDGYRMQAEQILARAQGARGTDQEAELLESARDHYTQAINLYREVGSFASARANLTNSAAQLRGILSRLEELGIW